jgi:hypothetical protein
LFGRLLQGFPVLQPPGHPGEPQPELDILRIVLEGLPVVLLCFFMKSQIKAGGAEAAQNFVVLGSLVPGPGEGRQRRAQVSPLEAVEAQAFQQGQGIGIYLLGLAQDF